MFGIGGWEFVLIAVLALLLFGPDKLPQFARTVGRFMRDFKRYQSLMESTIRAEVFANDPNLKKDPFETGKEFRKKVAGGGFSRPEDAPAAGEPSADDAPAGDAPAEDAPADDAPAGEAGAAASDETGEVQGEGEQADA